MEQVSSWKQDYSLNSSVFDRLSTDTIALLTISGGDPDNKSSHNMEQYDRRIADGETRIRRTRKEEADMGLDSLFG